VITTDEEIPRPFRYFAEEMEDLMANKARLSTADGGLTSAYEIESRTGNRATKVSQKLRQEKDRDSMTSLDKSFTEVVARINETLIHLFRYFPQKFQSDPITRALAAPSDLPLYEVFYFNSVKTLEDVITLVYPESRLHLLMSRYSLHNLAKLIKLRFEIQRIGYHVHVVRRKMIMTLSWQVNLQQVFYMNNTWRLRQP